MENHFSSCLSRCWVLVLFFLFAGLACPPILAEGGISEKPGDMVLRFAPVITHEISGDSSRHSWDFITSVDFDGDSIGKNNEENLRSGKFRLPATVYYALLETETHFSWSTFKCAHNHVVQILIRYMDQLWYKKSQQNETKNISLHEERLRKFICGAIQYAAFLF